MARMSGGHLRLQVVLSDVGLRVALEVALAELPSDAEDGFPSLSHEFRFCSHRYTLSKIGCKTASMAIPFCSWVMACSSLLCFLTTQKDSRAPPFFKPADQPGGPQAL